LAHFVKVLAYGNNLDFHGSNLLPDWLLGEFLGVGFPVGLIPNTFNMTLIGLLVNRCLQNNPKKFPGVYFRESLAGWWFGYLIRRT
jgi:hypothetical protein